MCQRIYVHFTTCNCQLFHRRNKCAHGPSSQRCLARPFHPSLVHKVERQCPYHYRITRLRKGCPEARSLPQGFVNAYHLPIAKSMAAAAQQRASDERGCARETSEEVGGGKRKDTGGDNRPRKRRQAEPGEGHAVAEEMDVDGGSSDPEPSYGFRTCKHDLCDVFEAIADAEEFEYDTLDEVVNKEPDSELDTTDEEVEPRRPRVTYETESERVEYSAHDRMSLDGSETLTGRSKVYSKEGLDDLLQCLQVRSSGPSEYGGISQQNGFCPGKDGPVDTIMVSCFPSEDLMSDDEVDKEGDGFEREW
ncbi:hypothetical protein GCG54_00000081 [Colletotrichum gloeosporioides]|uniref:Uncharacterized protein n=1 Tax=Colletotrichum gloeosporioides TaxID=474922 RepID=A0A8H4CMI9_COLGL|nr:uncharacterized protein GCG54_00000081 [Colletotrichum gloeosporioides]KAF3806715.1 hypothetical protein GCG54_00000081 [Colletotrichum gloeosporioides]